MSIATRRDRHRKERHDLIVETARGLAEAEGWDAVTTRRLAGLIDYSQPVLYSHFPGGKAEIMRAVAIEGFAELATALRTASEAAPSAVEALRALCDAYLDFAAGQPALYQAMFVLPVDIEFATDRTPAPLRAAFEAFVAAVGPFAESADLTAELSWGALHGIADLSRSGRIPPTGRPARVALLVEGIVRGRQDRRCGSGTVPL